MASVFSPRLSSLHRCSPLLPQTKGQDWRRPSLDVPLRRSLCSPAASLHDIEGCGSNRREALVQILFSTLSFSMLVKDVLAETGPDSDFRTYEDEKEKFRISIPQEWITGAGDATGFKSVTAFVPKEDTDSNVTVAITGIGPDFTRLESFGNVDAFAESLVSGLDRSWQRPPGVKAKLLNSKSANGFYYIEYTLQTPGEKGRHIFSAIGMASNGWYNRLYTVTGQFVEDEAAKYGSQIEKSVKSFRFI